MSTSTGTSLADQGAVDRVEVATRAREHGVLRPGLAGRGDPRGDLLGLVELVRRDERLDERLRRVRGRHERLPLLVARTLPRVDQRVRQVEDPLAGAEVGRERLEARAGEVVAEREHVVDRRAAPAEDALVHVADGADDRRVRGDELDELALGDVGVLVLVEEDEAEARAQPLERLRPRPQELDRERDLVAEVERAALELERAVGLDGLHGLGAIARDLVVGGLRGAPGAHLVGRDDVPEHLLVQREHLADEGRQPADLEVGERAAVERLERELPLAGAVEQRGVHLEADQRRVLAHDRGRERVVGLDGQLVGVDALAAGERVEHPAAHLLRRLDREGEAEDLAGARAGLDPVDDRALERARLARAGAGGDAQRARARGRGCAAARS